MIDVDADLATKTCPMCFEQIDRRARRCPHCRHRQTALAGWCARRPVMAIVGGIVASVALMWLWGAAVRHKFVPIRRAELVPYQGQIKVVSSRLLFGESKDGPVACAIGKIRNDSDIAWHKLHLQATFLDPDQKPIDVAKDQMFYYTSEMLPRGQTAFKVKTPLHLPQEKYASCSISITYAEDARSFP